jgi:hypothetical protein
MAETFTCAMCSEVFNKGWTEEEALAEKKNKFGDMPIEDMDVVCEDCYREIMGLPALGEKK